MTVTDGADNGHRTAENIGDARIGHRKHEHLRRFKEEKVKIPIFRYFFMNLFGFTLPMYPPIIITLIYWIYSPLLFDLIMGLPLPPLLNKLSIRDWTLIFTPLILILDYYLYILGCIEYAAYFVRKWNRKSPPRRGKFVRRFGDKEIKGDHLKYYHNRGFIIKYPLWLAYKSIFPWLILRVLRRVGHNKIGENVVMIECFPALELTEIGDGSVFYPGCAWSTHVIDSIFGNITIKDIKIGKRNVLGPTALMGPGAGSDDDIILLPCAGIPKDTYLKIEESRSYHLVPGKPLRDKYRDVLSLLPPKARELYNSKGFLTGKEIDALFDKFGRKGPIYGI